MNVTHLNCGTMREIPADGREPARVVCHCLVVEADHGLVLVETGFGTVDVGQPDVALGPEFLARTEPLLDPAETAAAQLTAPTSCSRTSTWTTAAGCLTSPPRGSTCTTPSTGRPWRPRARTRNTRCATGLRTGPTGRTG